MGGTWKQLTILGLVATALSAGPALASAAPQQDLLSRLATSLALICFLTAFIAFGHFLARYGREVQAAVKLHLLPDVRLKSLDYLRLFVPVQGPAWLEEHVAKDGHDHLREAGEHRIRFLLALAACFATGAVIWVLKPAP